MKYSILYILEHLVFCPPTELQKYHLQKYIPRIHTD